VRRQPSLLSGSVNQLHHFGIQRTFPQEILNSWIVFDVTIIDSLDCIIRFRHLALPLHKITTTRQQKLRAQITTALESRSEITLSELIEIYPIDCGMEELVEYLEIAHRLPPTIDDAIKDLIEVSNVSQDTRKITTMPRIIFRRQA
jgi:Protein of unknown function (DUF3375)